jgi:peroxiredoxin Q/BCP
MIAPDFSLPDQTNAVQRLSDYAGKWRIVYFYPKDDTPGCTKEACNFRDNMHPLKEKAIIVFGISKDSIKSHQKFTDKFSLNFPLLSDPTLETIKAYGAWGAKKFMGREFMGILRKTFLINPDGEIVKEYFGMNLETQAEEIVKDIETV